MDNFGSIQDYEKLYADIQLQRGEANRMKRYLLFAGDFYHPQGGWNDLIGMFNSLSKAKEMGQQENWYHIVDTATGSIVERDG